MVEEYSLNRMEYSSFSCQNQCNNDPEDPLKFDSIYDKDDGKLQKVRLACSEEAVEAVLDRLPTAKVIREEDGVYIISAEVFGKGIDMWIRSQGDKVKQVL